MGEKSGKVFARRIEQLIRASLDVLLVDKALVLALLAMRKAASSAAKLCLSGHHPCLRVCSLGAAARLLCNTFSGLSPVSLFVDRASLGLGSSDL